MFKQQQHYGGQGQNQDQSYAQQDQQDPSQQDPSQYGGPQGDQDQGYGQQDQQDPSQQDPSQYGGQPGAGYGVQDQSQQDITQQYARQQSHMSGPHQSGDYGNEMDPSNPPQKPPQKPMGGMGTQAMTKPPHNQGMVPPPSQKGQSMHQKYGKDHHNAMHQAGKVAAAGFTPQHMESFLHLAYYTLGALGNQHGLTPDAPAEEQDHAGQGQMMQ